MGACASSGGLRKVNRHVETIGAIQTRLILEARPKMKEPMAGREENSIKLTGEVLVRTDPMGDWLDLAMTSMRKDYFKRIADDYKFDLRGALRRF